jgi:hypothetical protein
VSSQERFSSKNSAETTSSAADVRRTATALRRSVRIASVYALMTAAAMVSGVGSSPSGATSMPRTVVAASVATGAR